MKNQAINHQNSSRSTSFQNRNFRARPARFTIEDESEGVELFLRGLLMLSLVVSLAICNLYLTASHSQPSTLPTHNTAVAAAQPAAAPATEAL